MEDKTHKAVMEMAKKFAKEWDEDRVRTIKRDTEKKILEKLEPVLCDCRWFATGGQLPHQDLCKFKRWKIKNLKK